MHKGTMVLVTGANGFLGANTVLSLINKGYRVKAMVRKNSNRTALKDADCEIFEGDITNIYDIDRAIKGCRYVIHSASRTEQFPNKWELYKRINLNSTALLVEACKKHNIKRFVYISTANCFTNGTQRMPGTEKSEFIPWMKKSGYAYSKYLAQQMVLYEARTNDFPVIVLAPTFMIGPRDTKPSSGKLLLYSLNNKILFYPPGGKSFVDVNNVAEAIVTSLSKGRVGECYLLSGINLTYKSFFQYVKKIRGNRQLLIPVPGWFLFLTAMAGSFFEKIFRIYLPLNRPNQRLLCLGNYFSNYKAQKELEFKNSSVNELISAAYNWFIKNNYLK